MPIYEYSCTACNNRFQRLVRASARPEEATSCPKCGSTEVERRHSTFASTSSGTSPTTSTAGCGSSGFS